ncbi:Protein AIG1-like isoform X3 [Oopsacas minuta]|uniref:Protein AIG1-like isoform X3 n=1 Tax=Oopsacas minuta TaxID=111878 RepID=A0AAV7JL85_9METZ|nr:Protein AIG1-like isoform X3 [Oopsacas minuta]
MATSGPSPDIEYEDYFEIEKPSNYDISLLFIGATGAGKSTLCNFLVKSQFFEAKSSMKSVTNITKSYFFEFNEKIFKVIDCPGFVDIDKETSKVLSEICRAGMLARDGLDAIVFVINGSDRFSDKRHQQAIHILNTLGDTFWKYSFIVFTHEAKMTDSQNESSESFLQSYIDSPGCSEIFIDIYKRVDKRYMKIELMSPEYSQSNEYWEKKVIELVDHISVINSMNKSIRFNCDLMIKGKDLYVQCHKLIMKEKSLLDEVEILKFQLEMCKIDSSQRTKKLDEMQDSLSGQEGFTQEMVTLRQQISEDETKCKNTENRQKDAQKEIKNIQSEMSTNVNTFWEKYKWKFLTFANVATVVALFGRYVLRAMMQ